MIEVSVRSFVSLPDPPDGLRPGHRMELTVQEGTTLAQLVKEVLGVTEDYAGVVAVNGQVGSLEHVLRAGDCVDVFPLVAGG